MTRVRFALVDVHLAAGSRKPAGAVAPEGPGSVDAQTLVLAGVALGALVYVFGAVGALKAVGTRADVGAVDGTGVADGALVARVARAGVVQVAQQTCLSRRALAVEGPDAVVARGTVEAGGYGAVVDVLGAVRAGPAVDADAGVASDGVGAGRPVLAHAGPDGTLVHVLAAVRARVTGRAVARVRVDAVQTGGAVLAQVARAVVHIGLTVCARESRWTRTLVAEGVDWLAGAPVPAGTGLTRDVRRLALLAREARFTDAAERALSVDAGPVHAGSRLTLVHVDSARRPTVPGRADAVVRIRLGEATSVVMARLRGTVVHLVAVFACKTKSEARTIRTIIDPFPNYVTQVHS